MIFVDSFLMISKTFSEGDSGQRREMIADHWKANRQDIIFLKENFPELHKALGEDIKTIINQEDKK